MYAKGMSTRYISILLSLNSEQTSRFITREDQEMDELILDNACQQIITRQTALPKEDDIMTIMISLAKEEAQKLQDGDENFEHHFLEIVTQQVENTNKDIVRFERQKAAGYVPPRSERKKMTKIVRYAPPRSERKKILAS